MPTFFVGSSKEHKQIADTLCTWIEEVEGCQAVHWSDAFVAGDELYRKLLDLSQTMDGAIFVFGPDDRTWYRKSEIDSPRDNVVFEYGLFTGRHGVIDPKRVIICRVASTNIASDLQGITFVQFDSTRVHTAKSKIVAWLKLVSAQCSASDGTTSISRHSKTKKELFEEGTRIITGAKKNVFLCAKTPIPLMGARPYGGDSEKYDYEQLQFEKYWSIAERAARSEIRFVLAASLPRIRADIIQIADPAFQRKLKQNLKQLFSLAAKSSHLSLLWYSGQSPTTFLVADSDSLVWFKGENGDNVWIRDRSPDLATVLRSYGLEAFAKLSLKQVETALKV